ncbi:hypothetical protein TNCV_61791 [Trichonephila clavipes]|nr:hypothetical protein TNCV_61791 [Trichonephila clavipes]
MKLILTSTSLLGSLLTGEIVELDCGLTAVHNKLGWLWGYSVLLLFDSRWWEGPTRLKDAPENWPKREICCEPLDAHTERPWTYVQDNYVAPGTRLGKILKEQIEELLKHNVIKECKPPYAAPGVLVPKPNGKDYHEPEERHTVPVAPLRKRGCPKKLPLGSKPRCQWNQRSL